MSHAGVWFGLGMMGLIGWSVAIPTLLGAALGIWLDSRHPGSHSWTLALLVAGLVDRLFECVALGRQGRQGHAGRTGGWR
jgi:predicted F0F1-ATPase subunit